MPSMSNRPTFAQLGSRSRTRFTRSSVAMLGLCLRVSGLLTRDAAVRKAMPLELFRRLSNVSADMDFQTSAPEMDRVSDQQTTDTPRAAGKMKDFLTPKAV